MPRVHKFDPGLIQTRAVCLYVAAVCNNYLLQTPLGGWGTHHAQPDTWGPVQHLSLSGPPSPRPRAQGCHLRAWGPTRSSKGLARHHFQPSDQTPTTDLQKFSFSFQPALPRAPLPLQSWTQILSLSRRLFPSLPLEFIPPGAESHSAVGLRQCEGVGWGWGRSVRNTDPQATHSTEQPCGSGGSIPWQAGRGGVWASR